MRILLSNLPCRSALRVFALSLSFVASLATAQSTPLFDDVGHSWSEPSSAPFELRSLALNARAKQLASGAPSWQRRSPNGADIATIAYAPDGSDLALAGAFSSTTGVGGGLYRSDDGGLHWKEDPTFRGLAVYDIAFDADAGAYLATADGVFHSRSAGPTWTRRDLAIGDHDVVLAITIDPSRPGSLWAGISDAQGLQPKNLLHSVDGGYSWIDRTPPIGHPLGCTGIAIDPRDGNHLAAIFTGAFGGGQIWISDDAGIHWHERSGLLAGQNLRSVTFNGGRLMVGGGQRLGQQFPGLHASDDDGVHWFALNGAQLPAPVVTAIAVSPRDPQKLWIATDGQGLRHSRDGGGSWQVSAGTEALSVNALSLRPGDIDTVMIGATSIGAMRSKDGGARFVSASEGMDALNVRSLAIDPNHTDNVAISVNGLNDGRVFASNDGGRHWTLQALPATRFNALQYAPDGALYAISGGPSTVAAEGLYRRHADGSWLSLGPDQGPQYETDIRVVRFSAQAPGWIMMAGSDYGSAGFEGTVWRSRDAGQNWSKVHEHSGRGAIVDIALIPRRTSARVLAVFDDSSGAKQGHVIGSDDDGDHWQDASTGLPASFGDGRLCTAAGKEIVYLSLRLPNGSGRIYRSRDAGISWQQRGSSGDGIVDIGCDPDREEVIHVVRHATASLPRRIESSEDGGVWFKRIDAGLESTPVFGDLTSAHDRSGSALWITSDHGAWLQTN